MTVTADRIEMAKQSFLEESVALRFSSPLFSRLAHDCAADPELLELSTAVRYGQPVGLFMPLIAHFLLLTEPQSDLGRYFGSLTATPAATDTAFPVFREFCLRHRTQLMQLLATRTANTNLVERASCIVPTLRYVNRLVGEPLTLVEICCSAALNLLFDEYHYDYGAAGQFGRDASSIRLSCTLVGPSRPLLDGLPEVTQRLGVDIVTIDPTDTRERLWMQGMLCPEWVVEREHLKHAQAMRADRDLRIIQGDALVVLPSLIEELPGALCVLHTYGMGQWPPDAKVALDQLFRTASLSRPIHRVALEEPQGESPREVRERFAKLTKAGIPMTQKCLTSKIEYTAYLRGDASTRLLGNADGFGAWLDWHVPV